MKQSITKIYCTICKQPEFPEKECTCTPREKVLHNTKMRESKAIHQLFFFEIESPQCIEVVAANNQFEAFGLFTLEHAGEIECLEDVHIRGTLPNDHKVKVSCIGFPIYETLMEMYEKQGKPPLPAIICQFAE